MEVSDLFRAAIALIAVIGLLAGAALLARRFAFLQGPGAFGRGRLAVLQSIALDARRRAIILHCDRREHLIVIGPAGETVIETNLPPAESVAPGTGDSFNECLHAGKQVEL